MRYKRTIGFVGAGNMAEAIFQGIIRAKLYEPQQILISDVRDGRRAELTERYAVTSVLSNAELATQVDTLVLSVKPKVMTEALHSIRGHHKPDVLIVSIVAGKLISDITKVLGDDVPIVRIMPNTPALINEGVSGVYANDAAKSHVDAIQALFDCVGQTVVVDKESLLDAVTAVSGSGPAYYFLLMEKMIDAAQTLGLTPETAKTLVLQTAKGAALLAAQAQIQGETPAELIRKVATPGGTTEAALNEFRQGGFDQLIQNALTQACKRSRELSDG